jgi:hypothetical protein
LTIWTSVHAHIVNVVLSLDTPAKVPLPFWGQEYICTIYWAVAFFVLPEKTCEFFDCYYDLATKVETLQVEKGTFLVARKMDSGRD